jgi:hypothetical protein
MQGSVKGIAKLSLHRGANIRVRVRYGDEDGRPYFYTALLSFEFICERRRARLVALAPSALFDK